jgi:hypothetical protein
MSNKNNDLKVFKNSKAESELLEIIHAIKTMKTIHDEMIKEGFTEEFIAIYLANMTKG